MTRKLLLASIAGMLAVVCASLAGAQDRRLAGITGDKYLISAKAGGVNLVSGTVGVIRNDGTSGHLIAGDDLQIGDRVETSVDGKAEILLNPGSYMRIGGNTSFEFASTDLENLKINLKSGSAVFEVIAADEFRVTVKMPQSEIALTRSGVFRLDVLADGNARISVFKGKALLGPAGKTEVGGGRTAVLLKGGISVTKFDRDTNDPLDIWSKERGRDLMKANAQLQRRALRNTLLTSFNQRGWDMYNSFGLWVFDPFGRRSCFLPFGWGWSSPYGWGYNSDIWSYGLPWYVYNTPLYVPNGGGGPVRGTTGGGGVGGNGGAGSSGTSTAPTVTPVARLGDRAGNRGVPPFERLQRTGGGSTVNDAPIFNPGRGRDNSPMSAPDPSSRPISPPMSAPTQAPTIVNPRAEGKKDRPGI